MDYQKKYLIYKRKYNKLRKSIVKYPTEKLINVDILTPKVITNENMSLIPAIRTTDRKLTYDFPSIRIACAEYTEGPVGVTLIYIPNGAHSYVDIRGGDPGIVSAPSTFSNERIEGICVAGGSLMGREAIVGTSYEIWKKKGYDYLMWGVVDGSIVFSKNLKRNKIYPDNQLGRFAVNNLVDGEVYLGDVGAGRSTSYGQGAYFEEYRGIKIFCLAIVNAVGNLYRETGELYATPKELPTEDPHQNTTITILVTSLALHHNNLKQLARQCHTSIAEIVRPFNTLFDGDTFYACSTYEIDCDHDITPKNPENPFKMMDFNRVCSEVVKKAILSAVNPH